MAEGFTAHVELWAWFDTEQEFRDFIKASFPEPDRPGIPSAHAHIVKIVQNTHRPKGNK